MSDKFQVANLFEMELPSPTPGISWSAIRRHFDVRSFGINAWTAAEAGTDVVPEHDEVGLRARRHEELYFVVTGRATFMIDGETIDAPSGTAVFVRDPAARRGAVAEENETTVLTVGATPGEAFTPSQWERSAPALGYFATQEYEKAHAALSEVIHEDPNDATVLFNLACAESLLGRTDDALGHLEQSIANDESFRELARTDTDFDSIRDEPRFRELVG